MKFILVSLIDFYQKFLSFDKGILAFFAPGGACRNEVSCSEYTKQMVIKYGAVQGIRMGAQRIWRCR